MAYQLVAEVLYHAPKTIDGPARLMLVGIAEKVRVGRSVDMSRDDLAVCAAVKVGSVRKVMRELEKLGYDPRVSFGTDGNGDPIYTVRGRSPRYRLPNFPAPSGCLCDLCRPQQGGPAEPPNEELPAQQGGPVEPPCDPLGGPAEPPKFETAGQQGGPTEPPTQEGGPAGAIRGSRGTPLPSSVNQIRSDQDDETSELPANARLIHAALLAEGREHTRAETLAVLAAVTAVAVKSTRRAPGDRYLQKIATTNGFGGFLDEIRASANAQAAADLTAEIDHLIETAPACAHGTTGGIATHPRTGEPLCAQCRHGIPAAKEPDPEPTPADEVMRRYRQAWLAAGHTPAIPARLILTLAAEARRFTEAGHTPDDIQPFITAAAQAGSSMSAIITTGKAA